MLRKDERKVRSGDSRKALRFTMQIPLRYRVSGEVNWYEGRIENISRAGVLFRGERQLEPKTSIEMSFVFPVEVSGEPAAEVICRGNIMRVVPSSGAGVKPAISASILDYCFLRNRGARQAAGIAPISNR